MSNERRRVAVAIWHRHAPDHREDWESEPDQEIYLCMADAAINAINQGNLADAYGMEFQNGVDLWLLACFGLEIARDKDERNHRFLEESLELVQSTGCTKGEALQLVDYVYGRDIGETSQEVGGVMNTLAALCIAHDIDMLEAGKIEIERCWTKVEKIRAKQAAKPKFSPLAE